MTTDEAIKILKDQGLIPEHYTAEMGPLQAPKYDFEPEPQLDPEGAYPCDRCWDWHRPGKHHVTDPDQIAKNLKRAKELFDNPLSS